MLFHLFITKTLFKLITNTSHTITFNLIKEYLTNLDTRLPYTIEDIPMHLPELNYATQNVQLYLYCVLKINSNSWRFTQNDIFLNKDSFKLVDSLTEGYDDCHAEPKYRTLQVRKTLRTLPSTPSTSPEENSMTTNFTYEDNNGEKISIPSMKRFSLSNLELSYVQMNSDYIKAQMEQIDWEGAKGFSILLSFLFCFEKTEHLFENKDFRCLLRDFKGELNFVIRLDFEFSEWLENSDKDFSGRWEQLLIKGHEIFFRGNDISNPMNFKISYDTVTFLKFFNSCGNRILTESSSGVENPSAPHLPRQSSEGLEKIEITHQSLETQVQDGKNLANENQYPFYVGYSLIIIFFVGLLLFTGVVTVVLLKNT